MELWFGLSHVIPYAYVVCVHVISVHKLSQHENVEVKIKKSTIVNIFSHIWNNDFNISNYVFFPKSYRNYVLLNILLWKKKKKKI
jgi:hypothetical protein